MKSFTKMCIPLVILVLFLGLFLGIACGKPSSSAKKDEFGAMVAMSSNMEKVAVAITTPGEDVLLVWNPKTEEPRIADRSDQILFPTFRPSDGVLCVVRSAADGDHTISELDEKGTRTLARAPKGSYAGLSFSPSGKKVAIGVLKGVRSYSMGGSVPTDGAVYVSDDSQSDLVEALTPRYDVLEHPQFIDEETIVYLASSDKTKGADLTLQILKRSGDKWQFASDTGLVGYGIHVASQGVLLLQPTNEYVYQWRRFERRGDSWVDQGVVYSVGYETSSSFDVESERMLSVSRPVSPTISLYEPDLPKGTTFLGREDLAELRRTNLPK